VSALLCSYREAAALLGVGRNGALHDLIRRGLLRPVTLNGQARIPREQVEELARHGENPAPATAERKPAKRRAGGRIADFDL